MDIVVPLKRNQIVIYVSLVYFVDPHIVEILELGTRFERVCPFGTGLRIQGVRPLRQPSVIFGPLGETRTLNEFPRWFRRPEPYPLDDEGIGIRSGN